MVDQIDQKDFDFFPIMVLALVGARKLMDYIFTQRDLEYLDDVMPETVKKEIEERKNSGVEENSPDGNPVSVHVGHETCVWNFFACN